VTGVRDATGRGLALVEPDPLASANLRGHQCLDCEWVPVRPLQAARPAASPTASHRIPSLSLVFDTLIREEEAGTRPASSADLPILVHAAHREEPRIASQEDCVPYDPRLEVLVPWNGALFRLLPGSLERPVATVDQLQPMAGAIDPVLVPNLGYRLADAAEVVLRRVDEVARCLSPP
jgi:hypothetical protein